MKIQQVLLGFAAMTAAALAHAAPPSLHIYYVDVEGGQATLFVSPSGQSVLVDTGFPGARDAGRIVEAARAAGISQIDYLLITHYHIDHIGGYADLAKLLPIRHYVDHGPTVQPEQHIESKEVYDADTLTHPHIIAKPGDKIPVAGIDWTIVSSAGKLLAAPMSGEPGAGAANPYCATYKPKEITMELENFESVGSVIRYGKFRTVDLGDLLWNEDGQLACPVNRIGKIDVLLVSHHGSDWSGPRALVYALHPRVAIMDNGNQKGAQLETFQTLESAPGLENLWQLHWSVNGLIEHNAPGVFIANLDTPAVTAATIAHPPPEPPAGIRPPEIGNEDHSPAYWIEVSARADGTFTVTNSRNGFSKTYQRGE